MKTVIIVNTRAAARTVKTELTEQGFTGVKVLDNGVDAGKKRWSVEYIAPVEVAEVVEVAQPEKRETLSLKPSNGDRKLSGRKGKRQLIINENHKKAAPKRKQYDPVAAKAKVNVNRTNRSLANALQAAFGNL